MNLREAISLSRKADTADGAILLISSLETGLLETFIKGLSVQKAKPIRTSGTKFGDLRVTLEDLTKNPPKAREAVLVLDWEDFFPGSSLRSSGLIPNLTDYDGTRPKTLGESYSRFLVSSGFKPLVVVPSAPSLFQLFDGPGASGRWSSYCEQAIADFLFCIRSLRPRVIRTSNKTQSDLDVGMLFRSGWPHGTNATRLIAEDILSTMNGDPIRRKLLIVDLDDTLWRGTIGDDGPEGVSWTEEEFGYKHALLQRVLQFLSSRGILLAVCSKNHAETAVLGLKHPAIRIPFQAWQSIQINWNPKSENIRAILKDLNLTEDAFLFIDNTEFELNEVRRVFPQGGYLLFPSDNSQIPDFLTKLFSELSLQSETDEDLLRVKSYQARKQVEADIRSSSDLHEYLKSLEMISEVRFVTKANEERPFQLINKTNQFNLNGLRESNNTWSGFFTPDHQVVTFSLKDKLADHGIISVVVFKMNSLTQTFEILHWVLSCRVFSRGIEDAIAYWIEQYAQEAGYSKIVFRMIETPKNAPVREWLTQNADFDGSYRFAATSNATAFRLRTPRGLSPLTVRLHKTS